MENTSHYSSMVKRCQVKTDFMWAKVGESRPPIYEQPQKRWLELSFIYIENNLSFGEFEVTIFLCHCFFHVLLFLHHLVIVCNRPPFLIGCGGRGVNLISNFRKGGGALIRSQFLEGTCWERRRWPFSGEVADFR